MPPGDNIVGDDKLDLTQLPERTLEGKWEEVVKMYEECKEAHTTDIKKSTYMGTALHVAIKFNEEDVVKRLVNAIIKHGEKGPNDIPTALVKGNERGHTPLHLAASRDFPKLCKCIVGDEDNKRVDLVTKRNKQGETPLFVAARNGSKAAFAYLYRIAGDNVDPMRDLVRNDGDSILHLAIRKGLFELAVIIVDCYPFLATYANDKNGSTPLKVLATRPLAFRSGSSLSWWPLILYNCILVEPLDAKSTIDKLLDGQDGKDRQFPENYDTICGFGKLLIELPFGKLFDRNPKKDQHDREDPQNDREDPQTRLEGGFHEIKISEAGFFPPNYVVTCCQQFFSSAYVHALRLVGVGKLFDKNPKKDQHNREDPQNDREDPQTRLESGFHEKKRSEAGFFPPNYVTCQQFFSSAYVHALRLVGVAFDEIRETKKKHTWSCQLLDKLMKDPHKAYTGGWKQPPEVDPHSKGKKPDSTTKTTEPDKVKNITITETTEPDQAKDSDSDETPLLLAARNGICEMVTEIISKLPSTVHEKNSKRENVLLVAVLYRQPDVLETLKRKAPPGVWSSLILAEDEKENTMLHLAARALGDEKDKQIPGSALQMMWDIKWYEYIMSLMPKHYYFRSNTKKETARDIFKRTHGSLIKESNEWLKDTSESCSVVAALVAGVSFATAATVPGGNGDNGQPPFKGQPAFDAFAISSLVGLCFSATGLIMFLTILTSRKEARDFRRGLPMKLLLGLSSLFLSILAMFVSFYSGHFFNINHKYKDIFLPLYVATSLPVAFYAVAQFPLYKDLLTTIFGKVPLAKDKGGTL